jgi:hypothetical protein
MRHKATSIEWCLSICKSDTPPRRFPLRYRLPLQAQVGERVLAVPISDEPGHLAVANVEQGRCLRSHLSEFLLACLRRAIRAPWRSTV